MDYQCFSRVFPRMSLPEDFCAEDFSAVQKAVEKLLALEMKDPYLAREWFLLFHELAIFSMDKQIQLELLCNLNNQDNTTFERLSYYNEVILKYLLDHREPLIQKYLASPWKSCMHPDDRGKLEREFRMRLPFVSPLLTSLQVQEQEIIAFYRKLMSGMCVSWKGGETFISIITGLQYSFEESMRQEAYLKHWETLENHENQLQKIFDDLLKCRLEQGVCSHASYTSLAFSELGRLEFQKEDCALFRNHILKHITPKVEELFTSFPSFFPHQKVEGWNEMFWPLEEDAFYHFKSPLFTMKENTRHLLSSISPFLGDFFQKMDQNHLIGISPSYHKNPGTFCVTISEYATPYIYGSLSGSIKDLFILLHEFGHALHGHLSSFGFTFPLRTAGLEFCETSSLLMEFLGLYHLPSLSLPSQIREEVKKWRYFQGLMFLPFMATLDEWQHRVYEEKIFCHQTRNQLWLELTQKYRPYLKENKYLKLGWMSRPHVFSSPFYFMEYGIALVGSMNFMEKYAQDPSSYLQKFLYTMGLGGQRSVQELFQAMTIPWSIEENAVKRAGEILFQGIIQK